MGSTALVSGSAGHLRTVRDALEQLGFEVIGVDHPARIPELRVGLGSDALDSYIQLPFDIATPQATLVERTASFLAEGLLTRFAAAAAAIPLLRPGATVVLVAGHRAPGELPDDPGARRDLLRVLARAVTGETASRGVRTLVVDHEHSATDIAEVAAGRVPPGGLDPKRFAALPSDGSYDDWRRDLLSLTSADGPTWQAQPNPEDYDW